MKENNFKLTKVPKVTAEEIFELFGTGMDEEELRIVAQSGNYRLKLINMTKNLEPFLDEVFSKSLDVFYIDSFIEEIVKLPIPVHLKEHSTDMIEQRRAISREYLFERCDYFADYRLCIKHRAEDELAINVALIHPESTLYIFDNFDTFINLREYGRESKSISINTSKISHITTETGKAGSRVSTIHLTDEIIKI